MSSEILSDNTNQYSMQKNEKSVETKVKEIEQLFGMFFRMGLVQMAGKPCLLGNRHTLCSSCRCDESEQVPDAARCPTFC